MFQSILAALKSMGSGYAQGIGQSLGLPYSKALPNIMTMKSPKTGMLSPTVVPPTTNVWQQLGKGLAARMMTSEPVSPPPAASSFDTSTTVQRGRAYAGSRKKSPIETLLEQLAAR